MISTTDLHPMLVHFPIALVLFGFIAECASLYFKKEIYLSTLGFYLLTTGTLMALFTLLSGALFTAEMTGAAAPVKETHETFAWVTMGILLVASALRIFLKIRNTENVNLKWLAFALFGLAALSVSITGYFGGSLVYNYMMPL
ncbi:MAG TPA: DUF2231 domain-containing protein [Prolixibacteraceae bacterium]|jgi:uncharacterized membrane protein